MSSDDGKVDGCCFVPTHTAAASKYTSTAQQHVRAFESVDSVNNHTQDGINDVIEHKACVCERERGG